MTTQEKIYLTLADKLSAQFVDVKDDSAKHQGHKGVEESGGGHYFVTIVSAQFEGKPLQERHRMVYALLQTEMRSEIHALGVKAYTPREWEQLM